MIKIVAVILSLNPLGSAQIMASRDTFPDMASCKKELGIALLEMTKKVTDLENKHHTGTPELAVLADCVKMPVPGEQSE